MFRLACIANDVPVTIACRDLTYRGRIVRQCPVDVTAMKQVHSTSSSNIVPPKSIAPDRSALALMLSPGRRRTLSHDTLYSINSRGKNDEQFTQALSFLTSQSIISSFSGVIARYYHERDNKCYEKDNKNQGYCSIYSCKTKQSAANRQNNTM